MMPKLIQISMQRKILIFAVSAICFLGAFAFANHLAVQHGYTESWSISSTPDSPFHIGEGVSKSANSGHSRSISHSTSAIKYL